MTSSIEEVIGSREFDNPKVYSDIMFKVDFN